MYILLYNTESVCNCKPPKGSSQAFLGQNRKTQFRFFEQKTQLFLKNSAKTYEKTQFWVEKLSYFGENSVQKGQNSVFQKNQKRKKRDKCPKIKPAFLESYS